MNDSNKSDPYQALGPQDARGSGISPALTAVVIVLAVIGAIVVLGIVGMIVMHFAMMGSMGGMGMGHMGTGHMGGMGMGGR